METYSDKELEEGEIRPPRLAVHAAVEPAHKHDSHALVPAIESAQEKGLGPESVTADTHYGSDDNVQKAAELGRGTDRAGPPGPGRGKGALELFADFTIKDNRVAACPRGYAPVETKNGKRGLTARFDAALCEACPARDQCPAKRSGKRWYSLSYNAKAIRAIKRRLHEQTGEFRDQYRWRAGVEAMFSELDRKTGGQALAGAGAESRAVLRGPEGFGDEHFPGGALPEGEKWGRLRVGRAAIPCFWACFFLSKSGFGAMEREITGIGRQNRTESELAPIRPPPGFNSLFNFLPGHPTKRFYP